jgi:hypothetical protein
MKTIFIIIFILLVATVAALIIKQLFLPMQSSTEKKIFIAVTIIGTFLFELLFIAATFIPSKADKLLSQGIVALENNINKVSPNYTNEVLDAKKIESFISDTKQIRYYLNENDEASFVLKLIGVGVYISYAEDFCEHIEDYFIDFQKSEVPFTLHNIFDFLHKKTAAPILHTTKIIEIIILSIALLFYIILYVFYFAHKKGYLKSNNKSVTFGEEITD